MHESEQKTMSKIVVGKKIEFNSQVVTRQKTTADGDGLKGDKVNVFQFY